jgi:catechol 2,3-dioxygenase-like lactoylglutathione lyase family enzyme
MMIGYVTLGTNDIEKARGFYGDLLGTVGAKELMRMGDGFTLYGTGMGAPSIAIVPPNDGGAATPGNGTMTAITLDARTKVDAVHAKALDLGGTCEGPPGLRGDEGPMAFYGAYFRDLDGNKLCAFRMGPA